MLCCILLHMCFCISKRTGIIIKQHSPQQSPALHCHTIKKLTHTHTHTHTHRGCSGTLRRHATRQTRSSNSTNRYSAKFKETGILFSIAALCTFII